MLANMILFLGFICLAMAAITTIGNWAELSIDRYEERYHLFEVLPVEVDDDEEGNERG